MNMTSTKLGDEHPSLRRRLRTAGEEVTAPPLGSMSHGTHPGVVEEEVPHGTCGLRNERQPT